MLQARKLCGNLIHFNKGRCNFNEEFQKAQACHPVVWKYQETEELSDGALGRIRMNCRYQRLIQRGVVQSYEGHVNSDTRLQFGVDPSERFVMSGGEDCHLRLWSIKSGKLLFEDKFCNTIPSTVCWRRAKRFKAKFGMP